MCVFLCISEGGGVIKHYYKGYKTIRVKYLEGGGGGKKIQEGLKRRGKEMQCKEG